ncbi:hypothetical protein G647_09457 [Cladophialophora carrionii CBS 160.54]|uniref:Uncharacterized protein n=1 Tax=Cladophialophora carrionii CBS 160.54 TaxID=1279043 RepID=V9D018_9EURO|nr:uncharacterized protein G647_09457 [Cladophialophora carrionii CBS 160.54]ETI19623.1 hypothetical protein G647_09457 [Cladophialophora carrionii CBS 160.54]
MNTARLLRLQPLRSAAFKQAAFRQSAQKQTARPFHNSRTLFRSKASTNTRFPCTAHTITQRIRQLKKVPPELLPLGVVIAFALFAAVFAMGRKLWTDKTLRLQRSAQKHE